MLLFRSLALDTKCLSEAYKKKNTPPAFNSSDQSKPAPALEPVYWHSMVYIVNKICSKTMGMASCIIYRKRLCRCDFFFTKAGEVIQVLFRS